jgi:hypothetical protein
MNLRYQKILKKIDLSSFNPKIVITNSDDGTLQLW